MRKTISMFIAVIGVLQIILAVSMLAGYVISTQKYQYVSFASPHDTEKVISIVRNEELNPQQRSALVEFIQADQQTIVSLENGMHSAANQLLGVALFLSLLPALLLVERLVRLRKPRLDVGS